MQWCAFRVLSTPAGDVELRIPKVPEEAFFPSLLEGRHRRRDCKESLQGVSVGWSIGL
jgi:transposase-like protein